MVAIVTRAGKGSSLTATEVDANFTNLKSAVDAAAALYNPAAVAITGGTIKLDNGTAAAPSYSFAPSTNTGLYSLAAGDVALSLNGFVFTRWSQGNNQVSIRGGIAFGWTAGDPANTAFDVALQRDAANTLALRNGVNAQAFNLYNTYTDASNYERARFGFASNAFEIGPESAGTGAPKNTRILAGLSSQTILQGNGLDRVFVDNTRMAPNSGGLMKLGDSTVGWKQLYIDYTNTGTVGAVTINKAAGRVNIAAAGTSIVVTNSLVTAASKVFAQVSQADGTAYIKNVVPGAGSFTITLGAAATAQTSIDFFVVNTD